MRVSQLFGKTQRDISSEIDTLSHRLLVKTGAIHQVATGIYSYLPLGWKIIRNIENIIRNEMDKVGGQELRMPTLQPLELWQETGRDQAFGQGLFTLTDRHKRKLVLGPTHEEVVTELVKYYVKSYRDLPLLLYQIQTKFRDEPRPRGGLVRVREFIMKDLYSFDIDEEKLNYNYHQMLQAYKNIYEKCHISVKLVEADSGAIGGKDSHEFMLLTENGEDEIIYCTCTYAANADKAQSVKNHARKCEPLQIEEVNTPNVATIEEVSIFLNTPKDQIIKSLLYVADSRLVMVIIRGDLAINELKLKKTLACTELYLASEEYFNQAGIISGSASPINTNGIMVIADDSIISGINFIAGANKLNTHFRNVNYPRDFQPDIISDIAQVHPGDKCPSCGNILLSAQGIEVGHTFKLGSIISEKIGATFADQNGNSRPIIMGCYGIGLGRLLAAIIEQNHDERGIIWPSSIAPYQIFLCPIHMDNHKIFSIATNLYNDLTKSNLGVLFDDREESPGVKFKDADLLGIPIRVTISPRTIEKNSLEVKLRKNNESHLISLNDALSSLMQVIENNLNI